jgi:hypothetical protein
LEGDSDYTKNKILDEDMQRSCYTHDFHQDGCIALRGDVLHLEAARDSFPVKEARCVIDTLSYRHDLGGTRNET